MYEMPENGKDVPRQVGLVTDYTDLFVIYAFVWFYKQMFWASVLVPFYFQGIAVSMVIKVTSPLCLQPALYRYS